MAECKIRIPDRMLEPTEILEESGILELESITSGPDVVRFTTPVKWNATLTNTGGAILLQGTAKARAISACARCLEDAEFDLEGDLEGYYVINADSVEDEEEDLEEDEFEVLPESKIIDLTDPIVSALLLDMPIQPLCKDDCKGLCQYCGKNLNEGDCECSSEHEISETHPFAALKNLKFE